MTRLLIFFFVWKKMSVEDESIVAANHLQREKECVATCDGRRPIPFSLEVWKDSLAGTRSNRE